MTETLKNLSQAFIGESQARNRYSYYAKIAQKEGYERIAEVFLLTAEQEKVHAKRIFEHLQELKNDQQELSVEAVCHFNYGNTAENLQSAIDGETYEQEVMYPTFAKQAEADGLPLIANRLKSIAIAEQGHRQRYQALLDDLKQGTIFQKSEKIWWVCRECGYIHFGEKAPDKCPSCDHAQAYYQAL